jgi:hypothetical protein
MLVMNDESGVSSAVMRGRCHSMFGTCKAAGVVRKLV